MDCKKSCHAQDFLQCYLLGVLCSFLLIFNAKHFNFLFCVFIFACDEFTHWSWHFAYKKSSLSESISSNSDYNYDICMINSIHGWEGKVLPKLREFWAQSGI